MHASVGVALVDSPKRLSHVGHFSVDGITNCVMTIVVVAVVRLVIAVFACMLIAVMISAWWVIVMVPIAVIMCLFVVIAILMLVIALLMFAVTRFLGPQERGTSKTQGESDSPHRS